MSSVPPNNKKKSLPLISTQISSAETETGSAAASPAESDAKDNKTASVEKRPRSATPMPRPKSAEYVSTKNRVGVMDNASMRNPRAIDLIKKFGM